MSSAAFHPTPAPALRLVGRDDDQHADERSSRAGQVLDRRALDVVKENRLAAHAESTRPIDRTQIDPADPRWILAMQTQARLQGAMITPERRDELLASGTRLGLRPFEANLVIAVVQDRARTQQPLRMAAPALALVAGTLGSDDARREEPKSEGISRLLAWLRWLVAGAAAGAVASAVIRWLTLP
jgi:hypothetical protein